MQRSKVEVEQHVCSKLKSSVYFRRAEHQLSVEAKPGVEVGCWAMQDSWADQRALNNSSWILWPPFSV